MNKKTLFLIIVLFIIVGGLLYFVFVPKTKDLPPPKSNIPAPTIADVAQTTLAFTPSPLVIASQSATMDIVVDTGTNNITAAQLELGFDPKTIAAIDITEGTFFDEPITLLKKIDIAKGKISYILAIAPNSKPKKGNGVVAKLAVTTELASGTKTTISFLPKTLIAAEGIQTSVLKTATNIIIFYVKEGAASPSAETQPFIGPIKPNP